MWTGETELFENADVIASIYDVSEHAHGSLGITQGYFDCLFSFVKVRTAEFECSSVFVWTGIFLKTLLMWTRIFIYTDKKRCVFKNIRIRVDEALGFRLLCTFFWSCQFEEVEKMKVNNFCHDTLLFPRVENCSR